jgi:PAS domain S-box-containing protein
MMNKTKSGSITVKLLAVVIGASVLSTIIVLFIANRMLVQIIDQSQNSMYAEKLEVIWNVLKQADERLHTTDWVEVYAEDFKKSAVNSIRKSYYYEPDQPIYPWILDAEGRVILHPTLPAGDESLKDHLGMSRQARFDRGDFNTDYQGQKKWYIYRKFKAWNWIIGYAVPLDVKYANAREFRTSLLLVMTIVSLLSLLVVSLIVARFTKPIITLTHLSSQVATGNLDYKIDLDRKDEVGTLARSFDHMRRAIRQQITSLNHEIEERKQAEEKLQRNEENLRITLDSIGDAVIATDTSGIIVRMNPVAEKLTGWPAQDARGKPLTNVLHLMNALTREPIECPTEKVFADKKTIGLPGNTLLIARDGSEAYIADSGAPIQSDTGELLGMVLVFRDVTQERALQERLRQSHKMDAIGQLAGGVAHDFNNMLSGIMGASELLEEFLPDDPTARQFHTIITDSATRAATLTKKLLTFARRQPSESVVIDLHQVVQDAVALLKSTIDRRITIVTELTAKPSRVSGDFLQLQNVFLNLGINASHAMPKGGTLQIRTTHTDLDENTCLASPFEIEPGSYIVIEVSDTGDGISPEDLPRIFEPFFTTKGPGKGTGLGLASAFGTVQQHKGSITVYNRPEGGAAFRILLPATNAPATTAPSSAPAAEAQDGETVLVVDDEKTLRETAQIILQKLGYTVTLAEDGQQALKLYSANPSAFDVVLLDMVMPHMNGRDCFEAMQKINPDVRVILASGFAEEEDIEQMKAAGLRGFLPKPYHRADLSRQIQAALHPA